MPGYGDAWGDAPYGDPRITQPSVLAYGAATGSGTSRTTASFSVAANRIVVFCFSATSGTNFPAEPPVLSGAMGTALDWTYQTRGHENGTYTRQTWMFSAYTGTGATGSITWTTTNSMSANAHYSVVQFAEDEVDLTDPIVQPRGRYPELPPDNEAQVFDLTHEITELADPRNGILQYALLGAANAASVVTVAPGFVRLAYQQNATSWASETQWSDNGDTLVVQNDWPTSGGGVISHWVSVACEIRAAGTDNTVGRIRDRSLARGASTTDGAAFTVDTFTTFRDRDVWLAVSSARTAATPGQPTITDTAGFTWDLSDSTAYSTIASSTQKLWLFHARVGPSNPGANTVTITYPQTQTACAWMVSETQYTDSPSSRVQTKAGRIDSSGAAGFTTTFDATCDPTSSVMMFLAQATYDHTAGEDVRPGVIEAGWFQHEQGTATTPGISVSTFARHTPDDSPSIALWTNGDAAMLIVEFAFSGAASVSTIDIGYIDDVPTVFTPKVQPKVSTTLIDVTPAIFTPQPSTTSFAQTVRFGLGAFQQSAFDDTAFDYGTSQLTSHIPSLFTPSIPATSGAQFVYTPQPGDTVAAFQQDAFDDDTFQQDATGSGIAHIPELYTPSAAATVATPLFVYLTGTGGWDSDIMVWDDPGHVWDEPNIGGIVLEEPHLFAPVVTEMVTVPLLDATPSLFTPTVAPKSVVAPLINAIPALFNHQVTQLVYQADTIDAAPIIFEFSFPVSPSPDLIDASPEVYTPTVNPAEVQLDDILHAEPAVFVPSVNMSVAPGLIDVTPTVTAPRIGPYIDPIDIIDASPVVYTPSLERIFIDIILVGVEVFEPQKVNLPVNTTIRLDDDPNGLADMSPEVFEPTSIDIAPPQFIVGQFIDGTPLVMGPHVITTTLPTILLRGRYDPVIEKRGRYEPVILKHGQNARQGS